MGEGKKYPRERKVHVEASGLKRKALERGFQNQLLIILDGKDGK